MNRRQLLTGSAAAAVAAMMPVPKLPIVYGTIYDLAGPVKGVQVFDPRAFTIDDVARCFGVPGKLMRACGPSIGHAWHDIEFEAMQPIINGFIDEIFSKEESHYAGKEIQD